MIDLLDGSVFGYLPCGFYPDFRTFRTQEACPLQDTGDFNYCWPTFRIARTLQEWVLHSYDHRVGDAGNLVLFYSVQVCNTTYGDRQEVVTEVFTSCSKVLRSKNVTYSIEVLHSVILSSTGDQSELYHL